jgi:hypothetical protein
MDRGELAPYRKALRSLFTPDLPSDRATVGDPEEADRRYRKELKYMKAPVLPKL